MLFRSSGAQPLEAVVADSVTDAPDVNAVATHKDREVDVFVWNYHDDDIASEPAQVRLSVANLPAKRVRAEIFRVDGDHSNSFTAWKKMGSPQKPTPAEQKRLEESGSPEHASLETLAMTDATATLNFPLSRQGVYLVRLKW